MLAMSTELICGRNSSVVYGLSWASHCALVIPTGWFTQALPHASITWSAAADAGADTGVSGGLAKRVTDGGGVASADVSPAAAVVVNGVGASDVITTPL